MSTELGSNMLVVPFQVSPTDFSVFVVLREENVQRIMKYDPAEFRMRSLPPEWQGMRLKDVVIGFATEAEVEDLLKAKSREAMAEKLQKLSRGWKFKPDRGDHDNPYERIV